MRSRSIHGVCWDAILYVPETDDKGEKEAYRVDEKSLNSNVDQLKITIVTHRKRQSTATIHRIRMKECKFMIHRMNVVWIMNCMRMIVQRYILNTTRMDVPPRQ